MGEAFRKTQPLPTPKAELEDAKAPTRADTAAGAAALFAGGARAPIEELHTLVDQFRDLDVMQLTSLRAKLKQSATPQELKQADVWSGSATPEKLAQIICEQLGEDVVPATPKALSARMSLMVGDLYEMRAQRETLANAPDGVPHEKLDALDKRIATEERQLNALRELAPKLDAVPSRSKLGGTSFVIGPVVSLTLPGVAAWSVQPGVMVDRADRTSGKRHVETYTATGPSTPVAYGGYTFTGNAERKGWFWGVSMPFIAVGTSKQHGKVADIFIPGLFGLAVTERGGIGASLQLPIAPFITLGGSITIENPALVRITGPILTAIDKLVALGHKGTEAAKQLTTWVREHMALA